MAIFIKQYSLILYCKYRAFYHKSNINQQMHKIIDIYKMYLSPLQMFQQMSCQLQGIFSRELQELFTSKYTVWLITILYRELQEPFVSKYIVWLITILCKKLLYFSAKTPLKMASHLLKHT
jgi:hypothetical protein